MSTIGKGDFTNFRNLRVRGNVGDAGADPGQLRFVATSAYEGTMSVSTNSPTESNLSWSLTNGTYAGGIGITGTFSLDYPAITSFTETMVTVSGIRREDALIVQIRDMAGTVTTGRTWPVIAGARPENGYINLFLYNPTGTATIAGTGVVCSYTAFR